MTNYYLKWNFIIIEHNVVSIQTSKKVFKYLWIVSMASKNPKINSLLTYVIDWLCLYLLL